MHFENVIVIKCSMLLDLCFTFYHPFKGMEVTCVLYMNDSSAKLKLRDFVACKRLVVMPNIDTRSKQRIYFTNLM